MCDGRLGRDALYQAAGYGLWIGRPCRMAAGRPLKLEPELGPDCGGLMEWPVEHVVKLCVSTTRTIRRKCAPGQEETVQRLFTAARRNRLNSFWKSSRPKPARWTT
ncbi:DUF2090 domain-containing protein [Brucella abortus]|nr:DUF2090 domain-containing protein [Brucella abortus]